MSRSVFMYSSRNRPLNDSANPFSNGDPGSMSAVLVVSLASTSREERGRSRKDSAIEFRPLQPPRPFLAAHADSDGQTKMAVLVDHVLPQLCLSSQSSLALSVFT